MHSIFLNQCLASQSQCTCQETSVKPEVITEAVADAVDAAVEASEATNQPAVVEAVVDGQAVPKPEDVANASEATPMDSTVTETVNAKPETDSTPQTNGGTTAEPGQNRLFIGCVPPTISEDELRTYFEPVRDLSSPASKCHFVAYITTQADVFQGILLPR